MIRNAYAVRPSDSELHGRLFYSDAEYSFRFQLDEIDDLGRALGNGGVASLSIGTLQIDVAIQTRRLLFVWGYHPRVAWKWGIAQPGVVSPGRVEAPADFDLVEGGGYPLARVGEWQTVFDDQSGWLRVSLDHSAPDDEAALIATSTILGFRSAMLHSVWLQPIITD